MNTTTNSFYRYKPQVSLTFIIVGGGFAGLSAAFALSKAGHRCIVLESSPSIKMTHGPLSIASNLAKVFEQWGILETLAPNCCRPTGVDCYSYRTGEQLRTWDWEDALYQATGFYYHVTDQLELQLLLFNIAAAAGAEVRFGCQVKTLNPEEPSITLESGEVIRGDIIVGADGEHSIVREYVLGYEDPGIPTGLTVYATTVSIEKMLEDEELAPLVETTAINKWLGPSKIILGLPVKNIGLYCLYLIDNDRSKKTPRKGESKDVGDRFRELVSDWEPRIKKLGDLITDGYFYEQTKRESYDNWIHESNNLVLTGDACHSIPEYAVQRCAMIIEDAAVLGDLFSRIEGPENIPFILHAYQEIRQPRCAAVQARERTAHNCLPIRDGTADDLEARHKELMEAYMKQEADPNRTAEIWESVAQMVQYEAELEVNQWWADFGQLMSPTSPPANRLSSFSDIGISCSTEVVHDDFAEPRASDTKGLELYMKQVHIEDIDDSTVTAAIAINEMETES